MKINKIFNFIICACSFIFLFTNQFNAKALDSNEVYTNDIAYNANFENVNINSSSTVDKVTNFIWANDYLNTKTIKRNNSNMLSMSVYDSATYSTIGGFGIGGNSNLANCKLGEPYSVLCYFEMENIEFTFVEYVGGTNKWGSVIIYPNGEVKANLGGNNISSVSYVNNILKFNFTMSYNYDEDMNGYIKFTAYNATNAHVYLDDVIIKKSPYMIYEDYSSLPLGEFDTHSTSLHTNFYTEGNAKASFVKENDNTFAKISFNLSQNNAGESIFFINKLGFLNLNRQYEMSFDINQNNVNELWIYQKGTWANPISYVKINFVNNSLLIQGNVISLCMYQNNKVTLHFNTFNATDDWMQFQFIAKVNVANIESYITIDNLLITQKEIVSKLILDTSLVKTKYEYGEEFDAANLKVSALYSNDQIKEIDYTKCNITGYDKTFVGKQKITVTYENVSASYEISLKRTAYSLIINTDNVKKEYEYQEKIDLSNLLVSVIYISLDDSFDYVRLSHGAMINGYSIDYGGFDSTKPNEYTITIYYKDVKASFTVIVKENNKVTFDGIIYQNGN